MYIQEEIVVANGVKEVGKERGGLLMKRGEKTRSYGLKWATSSLVKINWVHIYTHTNQKVDGLSLRQEF